MDMTTLALPTLLQQKNNPDGASGRRERIPITAEEKQAIKENAAKTIADTNEFKRAMMHVLLQRASGHISEYLFDYDELTMEESVHAKMYMKRQVNDISVEYICIHT